VVATPGFLEDLRPIIPAEESNDIRMTGYDPVSAGREGQLLRHHRVPGLAARPIWRLEKRYSSVVLSVRELQFLWQRVIARAA
jgi:hypothetical protein